VGVEKDWRSHETANEAWHRRPVGPPDPDPDGETPVVSDRPCIAVAVRCPCLEGDVTLTGNTALYSSMENRGSKEISDLACAKAGFVGLLNGYIKLL
jgi:hypothetical protein